MWELGTWSDLTELTWTWHWLSWVPSLSFFPWSNPTQAVLSRQLWFIRFERFRVTVLLISNLVWTEVGLGWLAWCLTQINNSKLLTSHCILIILWTIVSDCYIMKNIVSFSVKVHTYRPISSVIAFISKSYLYIPLFLSSHHLVNYINP